MKTISILFILGCACFIFSCGDDSRVDALQNEIEKLKQNQQDTNAPEEMETPPLEVNEKDYSEAEKQPDEDLLKWNYSGTIGKYQIRAQIDFQEATHTEGTGAVRFPITGYYYYESTKIKIPIEGDANGIGMIYFVAHTSGGPEYFDGEMMGDAMLEDFSGTWSKGNNNLTFILRSR